MSQQQRYSAVPGFAASPSARYTDDDEKAAPGTPGSYEMANVFDGGALPPAHRASLYSGDPFAESSSHLDSQHAYGSRPRLGSAGSSTDFAGAGAGAGAGALGMANSARALAHQNIPADELWAMDTPKAAYQVVPPTGMAKGRKRGLIVGGVLAALVIVAIIVAVVVTETNKSKDASEAQADAATANSTTLSSSDPANFTKDDRLHQVFWGFAYEPDGVILPDCTATQANVTRDIQLLSQLTTRLHLYGANCNETALVMQAVQDTKVNMSLWLAIYVDSDEGAFADQVTAITAALKTYGADNVEGILVGNEYILDAAGSVTSGTTYDAAVDFIANKTQYVNTTIQALSLGKDIPIGTADAGSVMSKTLASSVDSFAANVHPYFGGLAIDDAAVWTWEYFQTNDVDVADEASPVPAMFIAETGWPTGSMNASDASDGAGSPQGDASVANLQTFLDTFVCAANANGTKYFYFEAFDEPWKSIYGGVEPYWGLFDSDRNLKNVTIPTCD
ncbi:hypothetical protein Q5752_004454 [Cryptotrichosporon argae]